jgi:uncharacterized protein (DUF1015 family)
MKLILPHWDLCFLKEVLENTKKNPPKSDFFYWVLRSSLSMLI